MACQKVAKIVGGKVVDYICTDIETGEIVDCEKCDCECLEPAPIQDVECREIKIGYDNGITPGSSSNDCGARINFVRFSWEFEVISWEVNGQLVGAGQTIGPFTGWTPQLQGWADFFNANNVDANSCANADFGFKPAPTWRFAEITDCNPRAVYGPLIMKRKDTGCIYTIYPILTEEKIVKLKKICVYDCETNQIETRYFDLLGNETIPEHCPECFMPCGYDFGDFISGESPCISRVFFLCDKTEDGSTPYTLIISDCGTVRAREIYTTDSYLAAQTPDDLIEYEPNGDAVDCETGEPFEEPEIEVECIADIKECTGCCQSSETVNTDRNGISNPSFSTNFVLGSTTAPTWADLVFAVQNLGGTIELVCATAECHSSYIKVCGIEATELSYNSGKTTVTVALDDCEIEKAETVVLCQSQLDQLIDPCLNDCPPLVNYDAVCNDAEQTINGVLVPALAPIIRRVITPTVLIDCVCVPTTDATLTQVDFFNFEDPTQQFTDPVEFTGACDPQTTSTVEKCDANGNPVTVVTISVNTSGDNSQTVFYDSNGQLVAPALPLRDCEINSNTECGCIWNGKVKIGEAQEITYFNSAGAPDSVEYYIGTTPYALKSGEVFSCNCEHTEDCPLEETEYCYDISGFEFTCPTSTIDINTTSTDLCGSGSTGAIPTTGDLCTTGGIRSEEITGGPYCPTANFPTTDALGAINLQNGGLWGPSVGYLGNVYISALGYASGTAPTITFGGTWTITSGISWMAFDCATGNSLDVASGYVVNQINGCGQGFNGATTYPGTDGSKTVEFDTSGVADLSTVVFASIVWNGVGDFMSEITINGQLLTPQSCQIDSVTTLATVLGGVTGTTWTIQGDQICTISNDVLGPLTCGDDSVNPTITETVIAREIPITITKNTHLIEGCLEGGIEAYTIIDDTGAALFPPKPLSDLGFVSCCEDDEDSNSEDDETAPETGEPAGKVLVSDNTQVGCSANVPWNLQVRNASNGTVNWQAVVRDRQFASIPNIAANQAYSLTVVQNASGLYDYYFSGTLIGFQSITITGSAPTPLSCPDNVELYIL